MTLKLFVMSISKIKFTGQLFTKIPKKPPVVSFSSKEKDIESDAKDELSALQVAFREKAKKEKELMDKNTSSEFWSCIVFKTQEQRDKFYELLGVKSEDNQYINGQRLIKALELAIDTVEGGNPGKFKCNKDILALSVNPNF